MTKNAENLCVIINSESSAFTIHRVGYKGDR